MIEIKAVSALTEVHEAQVIHYLTATGLQLAILLNFGSASLEYRRLLRTDLAHRRGRH